MKLLATTIFASAFLLFQVQPLIAKFVLPWFGGSPAVWTTCMLFFQFFLLAGYGYAHLTSRFLTPRTQAGVHLALLVLALATLPIVPGAQWKPTPDTNPTSQILLLLTVCLGLPFFVLSATGPLLQAWLSRWRPGVIPYRLYALSNAGSLLALLSYPFCFEPLLKRSDQATLWGWGFWVFTLLCAGCALRLWRLHAPAPGSVNAPAEATAAPNRPPPTVLTQLLWLGLSACGSVLLLATTNKLCQDVAVVPFLWVLPLSLYLLTFIFAFDRPAWYVRKYFTLALTGLLAWFCYFLLHESEFSLLQQIAVYGALLSVSCTVCHGELYRLRPAPNGLTWFYLLIAAGGVVGGVFVVAVAPLLFNSYAELIWGFCGLLVLLSLIHALERTCLTWRGQRWPVWPAMLGSATLLGALIFVEFRRPLRNAIYVARDFYGIHRVDEVAKGTPYWAYNLTHGIVNHGLQFAEPTLAATPTVYYNESSGVGLALTFFPRQTNRCVGIVGLGAGTLATYGRAGDSFRFYEINPTIRHIAETRFTFLKNSAARVELVLGDARFSLENEPSQQFDLLVLDAFSGDAVPAHLLTREAFEIYLRHLKGDGVIAVHASNRHLDLLPVVLGAAQKYGLSSVYVWWQKPLPTMWSADNQNPQWWLENSRWLLLTRNETFLNTEAVQAAATPIYASEQPMLLWTDDHASLFSILK